MLKAQKGGRNGNLCDVSPQLADVSALFAAERAALRKGAADGDGALYRGGMVSREWAVKVVEQHLALATPADQDLYGLVVIGTEEHCLGWFVHIQTERFARTREFGHSVIGAGYYLVDGLDGSLHHLHATADTANGAWIEDYLEEVRGVPRPDPLREQVAGLVRSGDRLAAMKTVRAAADGLVDPASARRYVDAVAADAPVPEDVRDRLPQRRPEEFARRRPVSGPNPEPNPEPDPAR